ncbi:hypothetical protein JYU34_013608 [Plutella xylostella]|uniref:Uncharacterized protein n=1 Tax=Plutella xylostella TaxID=51655 RepID=A0ABQ7QA84_PLUXY|nr:hypothetical protein JYU34_013608 [Plutella xylostella]
MALVPALVVGDETVRGGGLMDKLSNGMKFAKDFLASESVALKVAEFVVRAFQNKPASPQEPPPRRNPYNPDRDEYKDYSEKYSEENRPNSQVHEAGNPMSPLRQLVRLLGLQPSQISAVAVNALLFVAQMISSFLSGPPRPARPGRSGDPLTYILNKPSPALQDLLSTAKNESLPDIIEDIIKQQGTTEDISCVRLLICKITPFVAKMQKAVFGKESMEDGKDTFTGASVMYRHLPSKEEINERSEVCERKYQNCELDE